MLQQTDAHLRIYNHRLNDNLMYPAGLMPLRYTRKCKSKQYKYFAGVFGKRNFLFIFASK